MTNPVKSLFTLRGGMWKRHIFNHRSFLSFFFFFFFLPIISAWYLRNTRSAKSRDHRDVTVFEKLLVQNFLRPNENEKPAFSNFSGLKVFFEKLCFRDGLVWTVEGRSKAAFSNQFYGVLWTVLKLSWNGTSISFQK